jgi:hypothetical protein
VDRKKDFLDCSFSPALKSFRKKKIAYDTGPSEDGDGSGDVKFNTEFEDDRDREIYGLGGGLELSKAEVLGDRFDDEWSIS